MGMNKAVILAVSSILLLAAVVVAEENNAHHSSGEKNHHSSGKKEHHSSGEKEHHSSSKIHQPSDKKHQPHHKKGSSSSSSSKGAESLCQSVDYKETCHQSLEGATSDSPKELIKHAFNAAVTNVGDVISKSKVIQDAAKDPRTSNAFVICKEVLSNAIFDFNRSIDKIENFDFEHTDEIIADLRTWLSATSTVQQTCLDAFENTTGDAGAKMKDLLKTAGELSSNALAMVSDISKVFSKLNIPGLGGSGSGRGRSMMDDSEVLSPFHRGLLEGNPGSLQPNAVVAQDGSGQFKTIMDAVKTIPINNAQPFVIHIKAGVYKEYVELPPKVNNIVLVGDGPTKTKITGNKNFVDGVNTFMTATLSVNSDNCILRDLGIENSAGAAKHQAVALRVSGDMAIIYNCQLDGYQDTLYAHSYRQFYRDTTISGTIDFIFGDAQSVFQNCRMVVRNPMEHQGCMVTAQGRQESRGAGAIVLQNCAITAEPAFLAANPRPMAYLGRPWKEYSRTIVMQSSIDGFIAPEGWSEWAGTLGLDTLYYAEFQNRGPGADTSKRVQWKGIQHITPEIAQSFTPGPYIQADSWVGKAGIPYDAGMVKV